MVDRDDVFHIDSLLNGVDFRFNDGTDDEQEYFMLYILLFENLYRIYRPKTMDYVLAHVDEDVDNIYKKLSSQPEQLNEQYNKIVEDVLTKSDIPKENIPKAKISKDRLKNLINEQKQTLKNICEELKGQIKSTIYYIKNRNDGEGAFKIEPYFDRVVIRIKKMVTSGVQSANDNAVRESYMFLYGNPLVNIVTKHDDKVCTVCADLEANNPYFLFDCPILPVHPYCRCHLETTDGKGLTQLPLTPEADKLRYYDI